MVFVFPFHAGDVRSAEKVLQWAIELGGCRGHQILLLPAKELKEYNTIKELAGATFGKVEVLPDAEGVTGHPAGPNSVMRQAVWHCQINNIGPWMFWEPDCVPREPGWADAWEAEYLRANKPFMGELRPASGVTPDYLTGNMVIPANALILAPMLGRKGLSRDNVELAFDIVAASQILPQAHLTTLLQQVPKNLDGSSHSFPDDVSLNILRPGAIFFHPCKDGSLIDRLREQKGAPQSTVLPRTETIPPLTISAPDIREVFLQLVELRSDFENLKKKVCTEATTDTPVTLTPTPRLVIPPPLPNLPAQGRVKKKKVRMLSPEHRQKIKDAWARKKANAPKV